MAESTTPTHLPRTSPPTPRSRPCSRCATSELQVLLWERAREPFRGAWSLPGGTLGPGETLEESILRHLATKVDVREVAHLEQLGTWSDPGGIPERWELATAYLGLVPLGIDPRVPRTRAGTAWTRSRRRRSTTARSCSRAASASAGSSRTRTSGSRSRRETFTLAELRDIYAAALGYDVSATNLKRVLLRRGAIEATGGRRAHGPAGGRPAEVFRFRTSRLEVTDPFAVLRPPSL